MSSNRLMGLCSSRPEIFTKGHAQTVPVERTRPVTGGSDYSVFAAVNFKDTQEISEQAQADFPFLMVRESTVSTIKSAVFIRSLFLGPRASSISISKGLAKTGSRKVLIKGHGVVSTNWESVDSYLIGRPNLEGLIVAISSACRKEFGADTEIALDLYTDPEIDDRYVTLYIRPKQYSPEVLDRIELLSAYFEESLQRADGYLLITTDFRSPGKNNAV